MFERTKSRDEEHVDERAYPFFSYGYTGQPGHNYHWNSLTKGLQPTTVIGGDHAPVCVYCGRLALPIQGETAGYSRMGSPDYYNKGHCCVCKEAMDELEMVAQMAAIKDQLEKALIACRAAMPKRNPQVLLALMDRAAQEAKKDIEFSLRGGGFPDYAAKRAGFKITGPANISHEED